jgi:hypothetical protein
MDIPLAGTYLGAPHPNDRPISMPDTDTLSCRYFISYSGVKLPLRLVSEVAAADVANRNTFFRGYFDDAGRLVRVQKMVYGELELQHEYAYRADGSLAQAQITDADGELTELAFDAAGAPAG